VCRREEGKQDLQLKQGVFNITVDVALCEKVILQKDRKMKKGKDKASRDSKKKGHLGRGRKARSNSRVQRLNKIKKR